MESQQIQGDIVAARTVVGMRLSESSYRARQRVRRHQHATAYFCFVLSGSFREAGTRGSHEYGARQVIIHPAGDIHEDSFSGVPSHCFNTEIPEAIGAELNLVNFLKEPAFFIGGPVAQIAARMYREFYEDDFASEMVIHGLVLELAAHVMRIGDSGKRTKSQYAVRCRELLGDRFRDHLTLAVISCELDVHPSHLARAFRQAYGQTIGDYLRHLRVAWSAERISDGDPLAQIALEAGFCDQSHFVRTFRRHAGLTPGHYRQLFRR